jgi:hypothetical protein
MYSKPTNPTKHFSVKTIILDLYDNPTREDKRGFFSPRKEKVPANNWFIGGGSLPKCRRKNTVFASA